MEEQYTEVRGQFDDVASSIDRERLAKVAVEVRVERIPVWRGGCGSKE